MSWAQKQKLICTYMVDFLIQIAYLKKNLNGIIFEVKFYQFSNYIKT